MVQCIVYKYRIYHNCFNSFYTFSQFAWYRIVQILEIEVFRFMLYQSLCFSPAGGSTTPLKAEVKLIYPLFNLKRLKASYCRSHSQKLAFNTILWDQWVWLRLFTEVTARWLFSHVHLLSFLSFPPDRTATVLRPPPQTLSLSFPHLSQITDAHPYAHTFSPSLCQTFSPARLE